MNVMMQVEGTFMIMMLNIQLITDAVVKKSIGEVFFLIQYFTSRKCLT